MSSSYSYKATIKTDIEQEVFEQVLTNEIGRFGMFGHWLEKSTEHDSEYSLDIVGDASIFRFNEMIAALNHIYVRFDMSGSHEFTIDNQPFYDEQFSIPSVGYFGPEGKHVRIEVLNREITKKMAEMHALNGLHIPDVTGIPRPDFPIRNSAVDYIEINSAGGMDPDWLAWMSLQNKAEQALDGIVKVVDMSLKGEIKPSTLSVKLAEHVYKYNGEVESVRAFFDKPMPLSRKRKF